MWLIGSVALKSDQNGIEMDWDGVKWKKNPELKSDQNGIEMVSYQFIVVNKS